MYVRMFWGRLKPGKWDEYERIYKENIPKLTEGIGGFHGRQLLRNTENPDEGMSMTFWDTLEAMQSYAQSPLHKDVASRAEHLYAGEYWVRNFEIKTSTL